MKQKALIVAGCISAALLLTGCFGGGGSGSGAGAGSSGGGDTQMAGIDGGSGGHGVNPEPATIALLGGGLAAFAFLKRKKK